MSALKTSLQVVPQLGPYTPVGAHMPKLTTLLASLVARGPVLDACTEIKLLPFGEGSIHMRFLTEAAFMDWAQHLGLAFKQEPAGATYLLGARGSVTRDGRTGIVELHCSIGASEVPA